MKVELTGLDQTFKFNTKEVVNYIGIKLPDGDTIKLQVSEEIAKKIVACLPDSDEEQDDEDADTSVDEGVEVLQGDDYSWDGAETEPPGPENEPDPEAKSMVHWPSLDSSMLSNEIKEVLKASNVPETVELMKLLPLVERINAELGLSHPKKAHKTNGPTPLKSSPRRTVPKDSMGYPVVSKSRPNAESKDPSDIDGVPQL